MLADYLKYLLKAQNAHGLHSPFVFQLYNDVISSQMYYYAFDEIEKLRSQLLADQRLIEVTDFGVGSKVLRSSLRKVSSIARNSISNSKVGQLLFKLILYFQPKTVFELGTSLGVTSLYLAKAQSKTELFTFEGCPQQAAIAKENFQKFEVNPELIIGNLDDTLKNQIKAIEKLDFVFFDANHSYEATLNYFQLCKEKAHEESVFIFDDIYWSEGMKKAWEEIKGDLDVKISIDLFQLGMVFFRKKQPKQHFTLRF